MKNAKNGNKPLAETQPEKDSAPLQTIPDVRRLVEAIVREHFIQPQPELISFNTLLTRLPLSPRTVRAEIKRGRLPHVRLPGSRRLLFDWLSVRAALLRHQHGAPEP